MKLPKQLITANGCELNVTWVNPSTKQGSRMIRKYVLTTKGDSIFTAYKRPSTNKVVAFREISKEMIRVNGFGMRITGAGSEIFSCAYRVKDKDGNIYLIYHTPTNRFAIQYKSL